MNKFEENFFRKYTPEWQDIKWIIHEHWIRVVKVLTLWISLWALIPSFMYYNSIRIQEVIPFYFLEILLILTFVKVIYEIFNWYNDVWIITNEWVVDLDWALFSTDMTTVNYENIEWVEVEQHWIMDMILNKWDIIIHKIWDDNFRIIDAIIPYEAVNKIEALSKEKSEFGGDKDRFDLIMEALSWVMEDYLDRKGLKEKVKVDDEEIVEKIADDEWTIDLRKN